MYTIVERRLETARMRRILAELHVPGQSGHCPCTCELSGELAINKIIIYGEIEFIHFVIRC